MSPLFITIWGVLLLKLLWNVLVPIVLHRRQRDDPDRERGISMMPALEWLIILCLLGISALWGGDAWYESLGSVALVGIGSILGSYVLMVVTGVLAKHIFGPP
jgi:hypothetical protein